MVMGATVETGGITPVHLPGLNVISSMAMSPLTPDPIWASIVS